MERTLADLNSVIERASLAYYTSELSEPLSLPAARRKVVEKAARLRAVEAELDAVAQQLADYPPRTMLQRLWGPTIDPSRRALEMRLDELQRKFQFVRVHHVRARDALEIEERQFQVDLARHEAALTARKKQAEKLIATAQAARRFLETNPRAAFWGLDYLMRVAVSIQQARSEWQMSIETDLPPNWDLVDLLDIWGVPYQPAPKV
jgi:hypothetical protein